MLTRYIGWVSWALVAWTVLWPHPYLLSVGALVAWPWLGLGVIAGFRGRANLYRDWRYNDPTKREAAAQTFGPILGRTTADAIRYVTRPPDIVGFCLLPAAALLTRTVLDGRLLNPLPLAPYAAVLATALGLCAWAIDKTVPEVRHGMGWIIGLGLAYGTLAPLEINYALDRSPGQVFPTTIAALGHPSRFGLGADLNIPPWGPVSQPSWIPVSTQFYSTHNTGDVICVVLHSGALGAPWYAVGNCSHGKVR